MLRFAAVGTSHVGLVRSGNQDSAVMTSALLLVADGVGGGAAGEVASATAARAVHAAVTDHDEGLASLALAAAVLHAQLQVGRAIEEEPSRAGMATTLTAVLLHEDDAAMVHLGDSRAYVQRGPELIQITRDHTWTERAVQRGSLSEEAASIHPWRNVILRCVNGTLDQGDLLPLALRPGDRLLLASDGLTDLVQPEHIEAMLAEHDDDLALARCLEAAALAAGGRDNITVVVATLVEDAALPPAGAGAGDPSATRFLGAAADLPADTPGS